MTWGEFGSAAEESDDESEGADLNDRGRAAGDAAADPLGDRGSKSRPRIASACPFVTTFCVTRCVRKTRRECANTKALESRSSCVTSATYVNEKAHVIIVLELPLERQPGLFRPIVPPLEEAFETLPIEKLYDE